MSLANILAKGVAIADAQTKSVQPTVTITPWVAQDGRGGNTFGTPYSWTAIVDLRGSGSYRYSSSGLLVLVKATLTFTALPPSNGAAGRQEPIDQRDLIALPDGSTAPIVSVDGTINPVTGLPFALTVTLGTVVR